jgi:hypothetical protein
MSEHVVVLIGAETDPALAIASALGQATLAERLAEAMSSVVDVDVISWLPADAQLAGVSRVISVGGAPTLIDALLAAVGLLRLRDRLAMSPAGRLLNSVGPIDQSRVFDRAVRHNPSAMAVIESASVLIAADVPAVRIAWRSLRRRRVARALFGILPALAKLSR